MKNGKEKSNKNSKENKVTGAAQAVYSLMGMLPTHVDAEREYSNYEEYIANNSAKEEQLEDQRTDKLNPSPLISIAIVDEREGDGKLEDTLISIMNQTYDNWEVCIVLGYSKKRVESYGDNDRIKIILSAGDDRALTAIANQQLHGAYMMQLIPGDMLSPDALYSMAQTLLSGIVPEAIFADEERVGLNGSIYPSFKPDYGLITLLNDDTIGRPLLISKHVFDIVGGFIGTGRIERWEFAIKALDAAKNVSHIARVLITTQYNEAKGLDSASLDTLDKCLKKQVSGRVHAFCTEGMTAGTARIHIVPKKNSQVSIIIPNIDSKDNLQRCIESIEMRSTYLGYRIFIADADRDDKQLRKYLDMLKKTKTAELIKIGSDTVIPTIINNCADIALNEVLIFLNGSCEILSPDFIEEMAGLANMRRVGAVGGKLIDCDDKIISAGTIIGLNGWAGSPYYGSDDELTDSLKSRFIGIQRNVSAVSGSFMAIRGEHFMGAGMFDDTFGGVGWDTGLCIRLMRKGFQNCFTPYAKARLYGELPAYDKADEANLNRCYDAFRQILLSGDRFFNPNFDYASSEPRLASVPYPAIELNPKFKG